MAESRRYRFEDLPHADLVVDALYEGGTNGNTSDDPLGRLLPCGNQGGFRYRNRFAGDGKQFVELYSDLSDHDWPDVLDVELGRFTYYGDNKRPGHPLHETRRGGNEILRDVFGRLHSTPSDRGAIPPFFIFTKGLTGRDVVFRGLAVPGAQGVSSSDDLVAIWRSSQGQRFQNYRATFTVLDVGHVSRLWIERILADEPNGVHAPGPWVAWQRRARYQALLAPTTLHRSRLEQLPDPTDRQVILEIHDYFADPHDFEACAAAIWRLQAERIEYTMTRPSRDGGRDAIGELRVGPESDPVRLDFVLEAKCYDMGHAVGVRELSRLISRIRNRMFGVLVTTSYLHEQAYQELKADGHPIVVISARDIVEILRAKGYGDVAAVRAWLEREFPRRSVEGLTAPPYDLITTG
jgi:hypothetical protein